MNPCKVIDCDKWTGTGEYCFRHLDKETKSDTLTIPTKRKNNTQLVTHESIDGLGCVFAPGGKNRSFNRKHVRRNSPVSYYTGFSIDMLKDMDTGKINTSRIKSTTLEVREIAAPKLIATMKPTNMMNPDA